MYNKICNHAKLLTAWGDRVSRVTKRFGMNTTVMVKKWFKQCRKICSHNSSRYHHQSLWFQPKWWVGLNLIWCILSKAHANGWFQFSRWCLCAAKYNMTEVCVPFNCSEKMLVDMMTSSNGYISRVASPLCGEFSGHRWISHTKASDAVFWCFLWSASE